MFTKFEAALAAVAKGEFTSFGGHHEASEPLASRIKTYWIDLGLAFPGTDTAWSAVFVSWCVLKAGATAAEFKFSSQHSQFVHRAIANAQAGTGVFHGVPITAAEPRVGDIIQWNRPGETFDFARAATDNDYPSHCAIVVELATDGTGRFVRTIGGNEGDSVGRTRVPLDANGMIIQRTKSPFMCLIQTLK